MEEGQGEKSTKAHYQGEPPVFANTAINKKRIQRSLYSNLTSNYFQEGLLFQMKVASLLVGVDMRWPLDITWLLVCGSGEGRPKCR